MADVLVLLARGFEEIEAVSVIDVLRRAEGRVLTASIGELDVRRDLDGAMLVAATPGGDA